MARSWFTMARVRRKWGIVLGTLAVGAVCACLGLLWWGMTVQDRAQQGRDALQAGVAALGNHDASTAQEQFARAEDHFGEVQGLTSWAWLEPVPFLGRQIAAVNDVATIGKEGSAAGEEAAAVLKMVWSSKADTNMNDTIKVGAPHIIAALDSFDKLAAAADGLSSEGLVSPLADVVNEVQTALEPAKPLLAHASEISTATRYLLSSEHRFLVLSQNNTELRPTGGFMGSYGLVTIGPDGISLEKYADIYSLPTSSFTTKTPAGASMIAQSFKMRDANWWIDFPTSAQTILDFWDKMDTPQPKVDGVIAIDLVTIQSLLEVFGPITLDEYGKTFTADNLVETLTVLVQEELAASSTHRKDVLVPLATELLSRVMSAQGDQAIGLIQTTMKLAGERRIQVFTRDDDVQSSLVGLGWAGAMDLPDGTTDVLSVVDAVVFPSKMNIDVDKSIDYSVKLNDDGSADTTIRLDYTKGDKFSIPGQRTWFGTYTRVYRPSGSTLTGATSKRSKSATGIPARAEQKPTLGGGSSELPTISSAFAVQQGETRTETYRTHVPDAVAKGSAPELPGQPKVDASSAATKYYRLLLVKQPDLTDTQTSVTITVPDGWKVGSVSGWRRASGETIDVTVKGNTVTFKGPLAADTVIDVSLESG